MAQYIFGTGQLYANTVGGGNPLRIGALQDVNIDISGDMKQLYGQYQFPLDVARGKTKIEGKFGSANIDVASFNSLFFGAVAGVTTGEKKQAINEAAVIPTTPFTVTVANGATFYRDLGVTNAATGVPLKYVASGPITGQYSVNSATGVYTFASADVGNALLINYLYTSAATGGSMSIDNQLMGTVPSFELVASQTYKGKTFTMVLYSVLVDKLTLPLKQDDHFKYECTFQAQANALNSIGLITTTSTTGGGA